MYLQVQLLQISLEEQSLLTHEAPYQRPGGGPQLYRQQAAGIQKVKDLPLQHLQWHSFFDKKPYIPL